MTTSIIAYVTLDINYKCYIYFIYFVPAAIVGDNGTAWYSG